jgi:hypothetical protein
MKILVLVFIGTTSAFLPESCQGDRTQVQQTVLKIAKSTVEVHSVWHDIHIDAGCCVLLRVSAQERPRKSEGPTPRCKNITTTIFSANKQKSDAQSRERGESTVTVTTLDEDYRLSSFSFCNCFHSFVKLYFI